MEAEYLTPQEVAAKLKINERTVRRLLRDGALPGGLRIGPKTWRVSAIALKAYIEGWRRRGSERQKISETPMRAPSPEMPIPAALAGRHYAGRPQRISGSTPF